MKIGIITLIGETNYGQRLQNYATIKLLNKLNLNVNTINYKSKGVLSSKRKLKSIVNLFKSKKYFLYLRLLKFNKFNEKEIHFTKTNFEKLDENEFDYFICGSDQIWNLRFTHKSTELFFAKFTSPKKRIAFSASMGSPVIPKEFVENFIDGVTGMNCISVREKDSIKIIKDLTGKDSICTLDPTLLLDSSDWSRMSKKPTKINKHQRFILTYFLGNKSTNEIDYIENIAKFYNLKIINIYDESQEKLLTNPFEEYCFTFSPYEFVWLVEHCEIMITDSFHGCAFSVIFKKPFKWFSRKQDKMANMDSRMTTLFTKLRLGNWCIGDFSQPIEKVFHCDYSNIDHILKREKTYANNYLKGALNINEN